MPSLEEAEYLFAGTYYKIGHNDFVYYWCSARQEWYKSAVTTRQLSNGKRVEGGIVEEPEPVENPKERVTKRQKEVLAFIELYIGARKISPTLTEIGDAFNLTPRTAKHHVNSLVHRGLLGNHGSFRGIYLLDASEKQST